jgi:ferredoxin
MENPRKTNIFIDNVPHKGYLENIVSIPNNIAARYEVFGMKRQIIKINEELCNGCGQCVPGCPEGALQVLDGKARLVSDLFCDGLGACIGECPVGAIAIEEREAEPYDERRVMANIIKAGPETIKAHLEHLRHQNETEYLSQAVACLREQGMPVPVGYDAQEPVRIAEPMACGCPGSMAQDLSRERRTAATSVMEETPSELSQWPVQLTLVNPHAPYFKNADLLVAADCVPFSYAGFHQRFLRGKKLVIFCPKLDPSPDAYVEKLTELFSTQDIRSVSMVHMEVPCCFGLGRIVGEALRRAGKEVPVKDYTISMRGEVK